MTVEAEVAARKLRAAADETRYAIDAAGKRALYEAENVQTPESVALRTRLAVIERLEGIIRESARPLERIEGIKIVQLAGTDGGASNSSASLSDQVVSSALRYRTQAPLVDALLNDLGIPAGGSDGLLRFTQGEQDKPPA
ncbi:MAG: flotillin domain-containing protein [Burkholderiaceae bacterium]